MSPQGSSSGVWPRCSCDFEHEQHRWPWTFVTALRVTLGSSYELLNVQFKDVGFAS